MSFVGVQDPGKIVTTPGIKGQVGWGKAGGQFGAVAGGILGSFGPGGTLAGATAGNALGSLIGESLRPTINESDAMSQRVGTPQVGMVHSEQSQQLKDALMALRQAPPRIQHEYGGPIAQAYATSLKMDNAGSFA